jgi:hypothetical protein
MVNAILDGRKTMTRRVIKDKFLLCSPDSFDRFNVSVRIQNHYRVGDRLWVRETFSDTYDLGDYPGHKIYKATYLQDLAGFNPPPETWDVKWKPSIFMPRWASRITLEITGVRVERLQEITCNDCSLEGVDFLVSQGFYKDKTIIKTGDLYRDGFATLWDFINGKKYPWSSNPWVWVIEFRRPK